ncbi:MAG: 50S ribosomal protein L23 [Gammaproteobacteria bacterium]|nr:50S ribosomal protein L23 [Gammaproteobacteria bacterium]
MSNERLMKVLLAPVVSEKATRVADKNRQVVFRVVKDASKVEIKQAVELLFGVKVDGVQVLNTKGKTKRFGQMMGKRANSRKAYVRLQEGHDIDFANR